MKDGYIVKLRVSDKYLVSLGNWVDEEYQSEAHSFKDKDDAIAVAKCHAYFQSQIVEVCQWEDDIIDGEWLRTIYRTDWY